MAQRILNLFAYPCTPVKLDPILVFVFFSHPSFSYSWLSLSFSANTSSNAVPASGIEQETKKEKDKQTEQSYI